VAVLKAKTQVFSFKMQVSVARAGLEAPSASSDLGIGAFVFHLVLGLTSVGTELNSVAKSCVSFCALLFSEWNLVLSSCLRLGDS
jgi:hypothetical protein